jgi:hypothetical protein
LEGETKSALRQVKFSMGRIKEIMFGMAQRFC